MKHFLHAMLLGLSMAVAQPLLAHGEQPHHGGVVSEVKDLSFELVSEKGKAAIYILDHGSPVPTENVSGKLTVLNGTEKSELDLQPAGNNKLMSHSDVALGKGVKVIASLTLADKRNVKVRFSLK